MQSSVVFCKKGVLTNFCKIRNKTRLVFNEVPDLQKLFSNYQIRDFGTDVFLWILRNSFFKEPFEQLFLLKHSFGLSVRHWPFAFSKAMSDIFSGEYFLGWICRLGRRLSSIFQTICQKPEAYFQTSQTSALELYLNPLKSVVKWKKPLRLYNCSLFIETALCFLIPDCNSNIFVCKSSHFIKCFKKLL